MEKLFLKAKAVIVNAKKEKKLLKILLIFFLLLTSVYKSQSLAEFEAVPSTLENILYKYIHDMRIDPAGESSQFKSFNPSQGAALKVQNIKKLNIIFHDEVKKEEDLCQVHTHTISLLDDFMAGRNEDLSTFTINNDSGIFDVITRMEITRRAEHGYATRHSPLECHFGLLQARVYNDQGGGDTYQTFFKKQCHSIYVNKNNFLTCLGNQHKLIVNLELLHEITKRQECLNRFLTSPDFAQNIALKMSECFAITKEATLNAPRNNRLSWLRQEIEKIDLTKSEKKDLSQLTIKGTPLVTQFTPAYSIRGGKIDNSSQEKDSFFYYKFYKLLRSVLFIRINQASDSP